MVKYLFLIGSTDNFESIEELKSSYFSSPKAFLGSSYSYELPEGLDEDIPVLVGRGFAFSNDWCMDDTISVLIEVE